MQQQIIETSSGFEAEASYIEPRCCDSRGHRQEVRRGRAAAEGNRFYLQDIARRAPHTLSEREETLLARAGVISTAPSDIFNVLSNADFPYPSVALSDGKTVKLDQAGDALAPRAAESCGPREGDVDLLQRARWLQRNAGHHDERGTAEGALLRQRAQKYESAPKPAQRREHPVTVYTRLIDRVNKSLPTFERYLKLRKRMMGVDVLHA